MQKENVAIRRDVESLQRELGQEREKASRYQRAANSMQTHMDNKELFLPSQLSDVSILRSIEGLMDSIRTWSFKQGEETSTEPSDVDGKRLADYQRVAPWVNSSKDIDEIRKKKKMRRFFLRGYLALLVSDWVFRNAPAPGVGNGGGRDFWAHPQPRSWFLALEDHLYYHGKSRMYSSHAAFLCIML